MGQRTGGAAHDIASFGTWEAARYDGGSRGSEQEPAPAGEEASIPPIGRGTIARGRDTAFMGTACVDEVHLALLSVQLAMEHIPRAPFRRSKGRVPLALDAPVGGRKSSLAWEGGKIGIPKKEGEVWSQWKKRVQPVSQENSASSRHGSHALAAHHHGPEPSLIIIRHSVRRTPAKAEGTRNSLPAGHCRRGPLLASHCRRHWPSWLERR